MTFMDLTIILCFAGAAFVAFAFFVGLWHLVTGKATWKDILK